MVLFFFIVLLCTLFCSASLGLVIYCPAFANAFVRTWKKYIGLVIVGLGILVLSFGFTGFWHKQGGNQGRFLIATYETIQLYFLNAADDAADMESEEGKIEKIWSIVIAEGVAVVFVTLLAIEAISLLLYRPFVDARLSLTMNHILVCGYGRIGRALVRSYLARYSETAAVSHSKKDRQGRYSSPLLEGKPRSKQRQVVVIDSRMSKADIEWTKKHGVIVLHGDARDPELLQEARSLFANRIFIATGDDEVNLEVMSRVQSLSETRGVIAALRRFFQSEKSTPTIAHVHLVDQDTIEVARRRLGPRKSASKEGAGIEFRTFSSLDRTVRHLLEHLVKIPNLPPQIQVQADCDRPKEPFRLVQVGFDFIGQELALRVAELCQFGSDRRIGLTLVDRNIEEKKQRFLARYRSFATERDPQDPASSAVDFSWGSESEDGAVTFVCEAEFEELVDVTSERFVDYIRCLKEASVPTAVVCCGDSGKENLLAAESLTARLRCEAIVCPVFTWMGDSEGIAGMVTSSSDYSEAIPFGLCIRAIDYDEVTDGWVEWLAKWLNFTYSAPEDSGAWSTIRTVLDRIRENGSIEFSPEDLEAFELVLESMEISWEALAAFPDTCEDFRHSNLSAAAHAIVKLGSVGLRIVGHTRDLQNPRPSSSAREKLLGLRDSSEIAASEHNRWMAERLLRGWTFDQRKSPIQKKHPDLISWQRLQEREDADVSEPSATEKDRAAVRFLVDLCLAGLIECEEMT